MKRSIGAGAVVCPTPVFLIGSYDGEGCPNVMTAAWCGICCSRPPCIAVSLQKPRHSYGNMVRNQAFTVSVPAVSQVREADYVGIYSGRDEDKFAATGLTPVKSELVNAPYVQECPLILECKVIHTIEIGSHTQFIGQILDVKADAEVLDANGQPDVTKVEPFIFAPGGQGYYRVGEFIGQGFSVGKKQGRAAREE